MKLYKVPQKSIIQLDNERFKFYRIDGMYSYCEDMKGNIVNIHCCAEVKVLGELDIDNKTGV